MRGRAKSQQGWDALQRLMHLTVGSSHVVAFRLAWLALLFYGERMVFHNAANRCFWPSNGGPSQSVVHVLLVTDPQIIDRDTYPNLPSPRLLYPLVRHFSDNYLKNVWTSLAVNPNKWMHRGYIQPPAPYTYASAKPALVQAPDGVVWMGDLTDGGRRGRSDAEWDALVNRFRNIFWRPREANWEPTPSTLSSTRQLIIPRTSAVDFIPTFYLSGNHDIGLPGTSTSGRRIDAIASDNAIERFNRDFGMKIDGGGFVVKDRDSYLKSSLNGRVLVSTDTNQGATHELVLVNAQDLVGMDREGGGPFDTYLNSDHPGKLDGKLGDNAHTAYNETFEFIKSVGQSGVPLPRVLLTHVPLYRPEGTSCNDAARSAQHGVTRESKRPLHQGTDRGSTYQNMVSPSVSSWVLQSINPMAVFSGDDHDHCEYRHARVATNPTTKSAHVDGFNANQIPELTVKSTSMTEGVRKPGFARLSLFSPSSSTESRDASAHVTMAYTPCLLPDQIGIWTQMYLPFFLLSLVGLFLWPRISRGGSAPAGYVPLSYGRKRDDDDLLVASAHATSRSQSRRASIRSWGRDVLAVVAIALPFWIFCQTHFVF